MNWFRLKEGKELPEDSRKNSIEKTPEKVTPQAKNKLGFVRFQDQTPEEQKKSLEGQKRFSDEYQKLKKQQKPNEGDTTKGQRQRELGM
ncbi:MAG: hypothetical protein ACLRSB_01615 [Blautia hansenii]